MDLELFLCCIKGPTIRQFALHKGEKLKKRKPIAQLFDSGASLAIYPLRLYYNIWKGVPSLPGEPQGDEPLLQFGVAVSKRHFKKAPDRNRIKRLLREAYRLQRQALWEALGENGCKLSVFFIFTGKDLPRYAEITKVMAAALARLQKEIVKKA